MKRLFLSVLALALVFAPLSFALGAEYLPKTEAEGGNVVVSAGSEYKNLYVGGGSVIVNTKILGDLFAAGGSVNLAGEVEEDFFAAGGNVTISSPVMGDARVMGGNIVVNAPISGDLLVAGGTVSLGANASIGGDMWVAGGVINITAPIAGDLKVAGGEIYINSSVGGIVDAQADEKLTFGPNAVALGSISYCGVKDPIIESGAQVGTITKVEKPGARNYGNNGTGVFFGFSLMKTIMLLVAGLVLLWLMRARVNHVVLSVKDKFWHNVGMGFVAMVVVPILSIMLMVTFVGAILGMILLFWYIFALMLCAVFSMMTLGHFVEHWLNKRKKGGVVAEVAEGLTGEKVTWKTILWGALVGIILGMIPVLGWLVLCAFYLGTFGSMLKMVKSKIIDA